MEHQKPDKNQDVQVTSSEDLKQVEIGAATNLGFASQ